MIILSGGQKGGTGKTLLAITLAVLLRWAGYSVLLVDADSQRSALDWANDRKLRRDDALRNGFETPIPHIPCHGMKGSIYQDLREAEERYDVVIVDLAGADSEEFASSLLGAVGVYTTVLPSAVDMKTLPTVNHAIKLARARGNDALQARFILNKCANRQHSRLRDRAIQRLGSFEQLSLIGQHLHFLEGYMAAHEESLSIHEMAVFGPTREDREIAKLAAADAWKVCRVIFDEMGLTVPDVLGAQSVQRVQGVPSVRPVQRVQGVQSA